ncbi:MAG: UspA domain-containing protein [Halanaerobium sp. 4-GBenrich]|jgi:nucleotide-binding universal stress UspA family protein|uniref:Universal stress protein n=1 Tax=Halanaerobium congolense TaxID=54121 RepID=A0A1G6IMW8_9FIRM|nr:universal stress protein [Halanaerobium congolense]KXS50363.1 MAG: UspA domain-containing protein [Halanaerobium sp. T82-1]ODS50687.1 MAG: UspA domain-containing protein [Halanaerobium sp. 4-GBenrich]PUU92378.1 MAG: UspA domain-containing protein [Halanaerobium sp.]PTX15921.1 nucleotide-binding universal stress UspA family protein [Halanaerobium congolense]PXV64514.1 nucleotide-binding universal stress UspA family protein [Halanaerobium congolense]
MKKILVAVDGSKSAQKAAQKGAELAESLEAEVTLIHVYKEAAQIPVNQFNEVASYLSAETLENIMKQQEDTIKEKRQKILDQDAEFFKRKGIEPEKVLLHGDPADEVCEYAEENDFDLIIVADKGHGKVERFLLGSISDKIVRHSRRTVMVVK